MISCAFHSLHFSREIKLLLVIEYFIATDQFILYMYMYMFYVFVYAVRDDFGSWLDCYACMCVDVWMQSHYWLSGESPRD